MRCSKGHSDNSKPDGSLKARGAGFLISRNAPSVSFRYILRYIVLYILLYILLYTLP